MSLNIDSIIFLLMTFVNRTNIYMTNFKTSPYFNVMDEYMTRKKSWQDIMHLIPDKFKNGKKVVWEPFMGNGQSGSFLRQLGFKVDMKNEDFFSVKRAKGDLVISNPPYSKKKEVFEHLIHLNIPFILLVPTTVLHTMYLRDALKPIAEHIQLIFPYKKRHFDKVNLAPGEKQKNATSFYSCYICYRIGMAKSFNQL